MTMRYADLPAVLAQLELIAPADATKIARAEAMEAALAGIFDDRVGRAFGVVAVPQTRTIWSSGVSAALLLPPPGIRSVSAVSIDGVAVAADAYMLWYVRPDGVALALARLDGNGWGGQVSITGVWADAALGTTVPPEVKEALTFLTVEQYRAAEAGPTLATGPDGLPARPRNPWNYEIVRGAIRKYRLAPSRIGV